MKPNRLHSKRRQSSTTSGFSIRKLPQPQETNIDFLYEYYQKYNKNPRQRSRQTGKAASPAAAANTTETGKNQSDTESLIGKYVGNSKYMAVKYLGGGSFGNLYLGQHRDSRVTVAIKIERGDCDKPQLFLEYRFYKKLTRLPRGVPKIYTFGPIEDGRWNALVMELLGPSLEKMHENCGGRFSLRTVIQMTIQMIHLYRGIHESGILYRDTKPANFLLGQPNTGKWWIIHVIDLGFCKEWRREDGSHIVYQENKPFTGTVRYMSINNNMGREQSRRDDLEALVYMLIYFYKGRLPWQGITANTIIERYRMIGECKVNTPIPTLCSDMPMEYTLLLQSIRSLHFEERPSYSNLLTPFFQLLAREYALEMNDRVYDWTMSHEIKSPTLRFMQQQPEPVEEQSVSEKSISYSATKAAKYRKSLMNRIQAMANQPDDDNSKSVSAGTGNPGGSGGGGGAAAAAAGGGNPLADILHQHLNTDQSLLSTKQLNQPANIMDDNNHNSTSPTTQSK